jgi:type I restriction-modification system DNA methylase subunit
MKTQNKGLVKALMTLSTTGDPRLLLIEQLGFEHVRVDNIDRSRWSEEWKDFVLDSRFVAERSGFRVASIVVLDGTPANTWRSIAARILIDYGGLALVCIHSKNGQRWLWSSSSLEHRRTAAALHQGIRHLTVEVGTDGSAPEGFIALLTRIDVSQATGELDVLTKVSAAFDTYTMDLQSDISKNTFEALRIISEGLLSHKPNRLARNIATLEEIRSEVFILLYRLLFVLYAEAREIFPLDNQVYFDKYSMAWWREKALLPFEKGGISAIAEIGDPDGTELWQRCRSLFHLVMTGSRLQGHNPRELDFRAYYGTIFDDELHENLERWAITNEYLVPAIQQLTRFREKGGSTYFVDYSSFEIRQLGSIYEGLLEYHMIIGDSGRVEHTLDEQERKKTGSFFTPTLVIEEIVSRTLNPILEGISSEIGDNNLVEFENRVSSLRVLDPAMGSGHFLVGALEHLTNAILDYRERSASTEVSGDEGIEIKRTLVRRCLYGVDLNPLAVELAKMSLWLETANSDRPLSFLDAHLKCGNSLVGASFTALADAQKSIIGDDIVDHLRQEVADLMSIQSQDERDSEDVHQKVHRYRRIRSQNSRYGRLSKLLSAQIAVSLGVQVKNWRTARGLLNREKEFDDFVSHGDWKNVDSVMDRVGIFHWELEFPEVFFGGDGGRKEDAGFDAVIGNPPWISFGLRGVGKLDKKISDFYRQRYHGSAEYKLSTYALFIQAGIDQIRDGGYLSFILPDSFLLGRYFSKIRRYILDSCEIRRILLTFYDVFSDKATTGRNVIIVLKKECNQEERLSNSIDVVRVDNREDFEKSVFQSHSYKQNYFERTSYNRFRLFFSESEKELVERIEFNSESLSKFMTGHTGVRSLIGQKQIVGKIKKAETWKKGLTSGSQIGRYWSSYDGDYINIDPKLLNKGGWDSDVILNDKIMIRQTGDQIYSTLDREKYYHLNNIHSFNLENDILDIRYILGLLNSKLMSAYYMLVSLEKGRIMAQTDIETLEKLPIREVTSDKQNPIIELVERALSVSKELIGLGDGGNDRVMQLQKERDGIVEEIDSIVYALYGLSEQEEIELIEKQFS